MPNPPKSFLKTSLAVLAAWFVLLVGLELAARTLWFQRVAPEPLALMRVYDFLKKRWTEHRVERRGAFEASLPPHHFKGLYLSPVGAELLAHFQGRYAAHLDRLLAAVRETGAAPLALYLPSGDYLRDGAVGQICREIFRNLCRTRDLEFIDATEAFQKFDPLDAMLIPDDGHLSRLGSRIAVDVLAPRLSRVERTAKFPAKDGLYGDHAPGAAIWDVHPAMPYRVFVNRQGLRNNRDADFPKQRPRVLFLGDSFLFGPFLPNHDTIPEQLARRFPHIEFLNGAVSGYTVSDYESLFAERAQFAAPDLVVIEMLDNDLHDFFWFKRADFDRKKEKPEPHPLEKAFLDALRAAPFDPNTGRK